MAKYSEDIIQAAKLLYLRHMTPKEIKEQLQLASERVIYTWSEKFGWAEQLNEGGVEAAIERRTTLLIKRDNKTPGEQDEMDRLISHHCKLIALRHKHEERMRVIELGGADTGVPPTEGRRTAKRSPSSDGERETNRSGKGKKNDVSWVTEDDLAEHVNSLFDYQKTMRANKHQRTRIWLKSRQIGATWYIAFEALEDAIFSGKDQVFLSASKRQAEHFRNYIIKMAQAVLGITLTGNPIKLSNGAMLKFLACNGDTSQGDSGNVYMDEFFWISKFDSFSDTASAIATHKQFHRTYISTPSSRSHQAYPFWTGDKWKKNSPKRRDIDFPTFKEMQKGVVCPDKAWRFITTVEDAVRGGAGREMIDIEQLKDEYGKDSFELLFMCHFADAGDAVFSFDDVARCAVNVSTWTDHNPDDARPFGERECWAGYDPARTSDTACFVIVAPPLDDSEGFRVLVVASWRGLNFKYQAAQIKAFMERYRITFIGVDITGIGRGVYEEVQEFARREVSPIHYSVDSKNRLVMKMIDVISGNRIAWDEDDRSIASSFIAIRRVQTNKSDAMTFAAQRTQETGHADKFFAIAHALSNEPLTSKKRVSRWARRLTGKAA